MPIQALPILGLAVLLMALEVRWSRRHPEAKGYVFMDSFASASLGGLKLTLGSLAKIGALPLFALVHEHRVVDLDASAWWPWLVLLFAEDLCFYLFHRAHHAVRILWAAHVVHHSSRHFNLSTAWRQTLLTTLTSPLFWAPLALFGFSPWMILVAQTWSQVYQFGIHTEAVRRLGPLEWVMNTPSHHRVHHGKNAQYIGKNFGGIFIFWDRLFGTFEPEREKVEYGLTRDVTTYNPFKLLVHELIDIGRDVRRAPTWRARVAYVFGPPV